MIVLSSAVGDTTLLAGAVFITEMLNIVSLNKSHINRLCLCWRLGVGCTITVHSMGHFTHG
jgi:hypothetical protein